MLHQLQYPGYFSLILSIICFFIQSTILISLIKQTKEKLPNKAILTAYLSILFFVIHNLDILTESIYVTINPNGFNSTLCTLRSMSIWLYKTGEILMYLFYINRLYKIFNGTEFKYNKKSLSIFGICIVIAIYIENIIVTFVVLTNSNSSDFNQISQQIQTVQDCQLIHQTYSKNIKYMLTLYSIVAAFIETLITAILLRLYLKKLSLLSLAYDEYNFTSEGHKHKNERFLQLFVKTTTLVIVALIASYIASILLITEFGSFLLITEHSVISICIYLGYGSNDKLYHKICCLCHKSCHQCCTLICFCCCVPNQIDESLNAVITANSARHRFDSISLTAQLRRYSVSLQKDKMPGNSNENININTMTSLSPVNEMPPVTNQKDLEDEQINLDDVDFNGDIQPYIAHIQFNYNIENNNIVEQDSINEIDNIEDEIEINDAFYDGINQQNNNNNENDIENSISIIEGTDVQDISLDDILDVDMVLEDIEYEK
eukprot:499723_1